MTRRLTNQDAFDGAMLHLLNQGHSCVNASGQARYRGPRGKSAIGALIPDELYVSSMEGKKLQHWLAARGSEYDALRERFGSVTPSLLNDLQDLHDRSGACMPSLYRHLVVAGAQRIAQSFKLSMSLVHRCATYQHIRGPQIFSAAGTRAIPAAPTIGAPSAPGLAAAPASAAPLAPNLAAAPATAAPPAPKLAATPTTAAPPAPKLAATPATAALPAPGLVAAPATAAPPAPGLAATPATAALPAPGLAATPATAAPPAPGAAAAPAIPVPSDPAAAATPAPQATQLTEGPQEELDLIARGIAKAIAAASAPGTNQPRRR